MNMQDRLTESRLQRIATQLELASSVVQLRFESGTLLSTGDPGFAVGRESLTALPTPRAGR